MRENDYQGKLIQKIRRKFKGCVILKNDSEYIQGIPDLTILFDEKWAMLEVKASENSPVQPNQNYYVDLMDAMSFGSFVYPENEDAVMMDLKDHFTR